MVGVSNCDLLSNLFSCFCWIRGVGPLQWGVVSGLHQVDNCTNHHNQLEISVFGGWKKCARETYFKPAAPYSVRFILA